MGVQPIDSDFKASLPPNTVGLLLGRSSSALKGLRVHPGIIDPDYTGVVKIMVESPKGIFPISPGDRIAQLLVLPSMHGKFQAVPRERGERGFGSTGVDLACLSLELDNRPMMTLIVDGKRITGLLDTGADKSIIARKDWPAGWPVQVSSQTLRGLGYAQTPSISARELQWVSEEGQKGKMQPYTLDLPVTLWGRDILKDMKFKLTNEYSIEARKMMHNMGYIPGRGIGKYLQGISDPIEASPESDRHGLGFS